MKENMNELCVENKSLKENLFQSRSKLKQFLKQLKKYQKVNSFINKCFYIFVSDFLAT